AQRDPQQSNEKGTGPRDRNRYAGQLELNLCARRLAFWRTFICYSPSAKRYPPSAIACIVHCSFNGRLRFIGPRRELFPGKAGTTFANQIAISLGKRDRDDALFAAGSAGNLIWLMLNNLFYIRHCRTPHG